MGAATCRFSPSVPSNLLTSMLSRCGCTNQTPRAYFRKHTSCCARVGCDKRLSSSRSVLLRRTPYRFWSSRGRHFALRNIHQVHANLTMAMTQRLTHAFSPRLVDTLGLLSERERTLVPHGTRATGLCRPLAQGRPVLLVDAVRLTTMYVRCIHTRSSMSVRRVTTTMRLLASLVSQSQSVDKTSTQACRSSLSRQTLRTRLMINIRICRPLRHLSSTANSREAATRDEILTCLPSHDPDPAATQLRNAEGFARPLFSKHSLFCLSEH